MKLSGFVALVLVAVFALFAIPVAAGVPDDVAIERVEKADARIYAAIDRAMEQAERHPEKAEMIGERLVKQTDNIVEATGNSLQQSDVEITPTWIEVDLAGTSVWVDPMEVAGY